MPKRIFINVVKALKFLKAWFERGIRNRIKIDNQVGQTANEKVNITIFPNFLGVNNVRVDSIEIEDISYEVLKERSHDTCYIGELTSSHPKVLKNVEGSCVAFTNCICSTIANNFCHVEDIIIFCSLLRCIFVPN